MKRIVYLFFVLLPLFISAQGTLSDARRIEGEMKVKMIEEFMLRFNREMIPIVMDSTTDDRDLKMMALLFDNNLLESRGDEVYDFISTMLADSIRLDFTDTNWMAIAECTANYKKRRHNIFLCLKTEHISGQMYKWVITHADGEILSLNPASKSAYDKISPTDNELYFIQLGDITGKNQENILNYSENGYEVDQTSVFFALVASGLLKIEQVDKITYQFHTRHYYFWVNYFSRDGINTGWLISDFKRL